MVLKSWIDYEEFVRRPKSMFKTIGFVPYRRRHEIGNQRSRILQALLYFSMINLVVTLTLEFINFVEIAKSEFDIVVVTTIVIYVGMSIMAEGRLYSIWHNQIRVKTMIDTLEDVFPKTIEEQIEFKVARYKKDLTITVDVIMKCFLLGVWFFNFAPLFDSLYEYFLLDKEFPYKLPYPLWYPFEIKSIPLYMFLLITHWSAGYVSIVAIVGSDWLLCSIVAQLCMHFDLITRKLRKLKPKGTPSDHGPLLKLIEYHIVILKLSDDLNDIFNFSILYNFIAASIMLCAGAFQIVAGVAIIDLTKYMMFLVVEMLQVLLVCYFGQRLMDASYNVRFGAYEQNWFNADIPYKKSILMIILRSNKPCVLNAVSFAVVSLESFSKVISLAYKCFAVLRSLY